MDPLKIHYLGRSKYHWWNWIPWMLVLDICFIFGPFVGCKNTGSPDGSEMVTDVSIDSMNIDGDTMNVDGNPSCQFHPAMVPAQCRNCHGAPPQKKTHPPNPFCYRCHGHVVDRDYQFLPSDLHTNGTVDYAVGCSSCHGWNLGVSPPQNLLGECDVEKPGIGAHPAMRMNATIVHRVNCINCHIVPLSTWAEGHIDGDGKAEVVFQNLAIANGATPTWNGTTCEGVYCHGVTLKGGTYKTPGWYDTSGKARQCGACHQLTDPNGKTDADCSSCHKSSVTPERLIIPYGDHMNGVIDVTK
jgi:predicted CxxxxCH...CXXCH cytochrome family protein